MLLNLPDDDDEPDTEEPPAPPPDDDDEEVQSSYVTQSFLRMLLSMGCFSGNLAVDEDEVQNNEPLDPPHPLDGVPATYEEATDVDFHRRQQEEQMKKSELVFYTEFLKMMHSGFRLILRSKPTTLQILDDVISWQDDGIPLHDLVAVQPADDRAFSLVGSSVESPVFETVDRETRDLIVDGFDLLIKQQRLEGNRGKL